MYSAGPSRGSTVTGLVTWSTFGSAAIFFA